MDDAGTPERVEMEGSERNRIGNCSSCTCNCLCSMCIADKGICVSQSCVWQCSALNMYLNMNPMHLQFQSCVAYVLITEI